MCGCNAAIATHNIRRDIESKNAEGLLFPDLSWGPPFSEPKNVTNQHFYEETLSLKKLVLFLELLQDNHIFLAYTKLLTNNILNLQGSMLRGF